MSTNLSGEDGGTDPPEGDQIVATNVGADPRFVPTEGTTYSAYNPIRKRATYDSTASSSGTKAQKRILIEDEPNSDVGKMSLLGEEIYLSTLDMLYKTVSLFEANSVYCSMTIDLINKLPALVEAYMGNYFLWYFQNYIQTSDFYGYFVKDVYLWQNYISQAEPWVNYLKGLLPAPRRELVAGKPVFWNHMGSDEGDYTILSTWSDATVTKTVDGWELQAGGNMNNRKQFLLYYSPQPGNFDLMDMSSWASPDIDSTHEWSIEVKFKVPVGASNRANFTCDLVKFESVLDTDIKFAMGDETDPTIGRNLTMTIGGGVAVDLGVTLGDLTTITLHYNLLINDPSGNDGEFSVEVDHSYVATSIVQGGQAGDVGDPYRIVLYGGVNLPLTFLDVHLM